MVNVDAAATPTQAHELVGEIPPTRCWGLADTGLWAFAIPRSMPKMSMSVGRTSSAVRFACPSVVHQCGRRAPPDFLPELGATLEQ
jgi:hypothetical protein